MGALILGLQSKPWSSLGLSPNQGGTRHGTGGDRRHPPSPSEGSKDKGAMLVTRNRRQ